MTMTDADFQATLDNQRHTIPVTLTGAQLASALCSAFDGGSTYWAMRVEVISTTPAEGVGVSVHPDPFANVSAYLVPFLGGTLKVHLRPSRGRPSHDPDLKPRQLDLAAILAGARILCEKYPRHFSDLVRNAADRGTGDALLQCAVFGDLPFG
jgi:hypothetical protein